MKQPEVETSVEPAVIIIVWCLINPDQLFDKVFFYKKVCFQQARDWEKDTVKRSVRIFKHFSEQNISLPTL
jgi:hypothetical protein